METRRGNWMQTFTGRAYWPMDPRVSEVDILDIAHGLSNICRFGGQCKRFYSVAEHSGLVSRVVPPEHALQALLHDATEAYLGDMIRPIKTEILLYREMEHRNWAVIAQRFRVPLDMDPSIKLADVAVYYAEQAELMGNPPGIPDHSLTPEERCAAAAPVRICGYTPLVAEALFLNRFYELTQG